MEIIYVFIHSFNLLIHLFWKILLENHLAKKGKPEHFYLRQIFGGSAGLDIVCEAKFLDKTSPLHIIMRAKLSFPWHICKRQLLESKLSLQAIEIKHTDLMQLVPWEEDSQILSNGKMKSDQACLLSFTKCNYVNYKAPLQTMFIISTIFPLILNKACQL